MYLINNLYFLLINKLIDFIFHFSNYFINLLNNLSNKSFF